MCNSVSLHQMLSFFSSLCVIFFVIETSTRCHSFSALPQLTIKKTSAMKGLSMSSSQLNDLLGMMPLCLTATSKTTTTNDPTAGMSPDEILNYISNVGGGMCGYPDWARTAIGVGLNLSLIVFGLCTVSYGNYFKVKSLFPGIEIHHNQLKPLVTFFSCPIWGAICIGESGGR